MFYGTYIGKDRMLIKTAWGMRLIASCSDMSLMPTLMVDGVIEAGLTNWIIKNQKNFQGKNFIDVGANIGYFTVLLAAVGGKDGKTIAYEANPTVFNFLKENIYLSQLQDRVAIFRKAVVGDDKKLVMFNVSKKYQGNSSIVAHTDAYKEQFATDEFETISVPCENLSSYADDEIELVKIDVEGAELDVLDGMEQLIINGKVKHVVFELNKNMLGERVDDLKTQLEIYRQNFGALFYLFTPDGDTRHVRIEDIFAHDYIDNILIKFR